MSESGSVSEIENQLVSLDEKSGELLQRIMDLSTRLMPVTREGDAPKEEDGSAPREVLVPVAERIARSVENLDAALNTLSSVYRRLEV